MSQSKLALNAPTFLQQFAARFQQPEVQAWSWDTEADEFGLVYSWDVVSPAPMEGQRIQANASIDLQLTQLTLSISERALRSRAEELATGRPDQQDSALIFVAVIQFEDQRLAVDNRQREYSVEEIASVIDEFNALVA